MPATNATSEDEGPDAATRAALVKYRQTGDLAIRDSVIEQHMGLVHHLARRFVRQADSLDDLVQAGAIGLLKAVEGFDADLGFRFSAYAAATVIGELKRYLRDKGWAVRPPRRLQELCLELGHATARLTQSLGRSPTVAEIAQELGATEADVLEAMEAGQGYTARSLDPSPDTNDSALRPALRMDDAELANSETRLMLAQSLSLLPERDRKIVELRYFEDLTQAEIGERLGISQMQVSRLLARTLVRLRQLVSEPD
ncbi:MAG TPA: SigB/SigF/SigG family RNA polymerase sigma factor [Acidimicrobiales bacterium]|jgi:RNA polymerase sigma-B factor|nr:SigB/SigF/SigG family RNA polymerase sigma factor [Acidimicrobiales bacterium]